MGKVPFLLSGCLTSRLNQSSNSSGDLLFKAEDDDVLNFIPPHPARGSDSHRIIATLLEHDSPITVSCLRVDNEISNSKYSDRHMNLLKVSDRSDIRIVGYQFFRTCWTRKTSSFYDSIGIDTR